MATYASTFAKEHADRYSLKEQSLYNKLRKLIQEGVSWGQREKGHYYITDEEQALAALANGHHPRGPRTFIYMDDLLVAISRLIAVEDRGQYLEVLTEGGSYGVRTSDPDVQAFWHWAKQQGMAS